MPLPAMPLPEMLAWLSTPPADPWVRRVCAALIVAATVVAMEGVAYLLHRYWMHGRGWAWHRSHHEPGPGRRWERNDRFGLIFGAAALGLFVFGPRPDQAGWPLYWIAWGVSLYGAVYFLVHDGLVHHRWPWPRAWRSMPRHAYLARLVQAHRLHHATRGREGAVSFGFLWAPAPAVLARQLRASRQDTPADLDASQAPR